MTTEKLLHNLRSGNYFCALSWLTFVHATYAPGEDDGMDIILPLAVYELLNHGIQIEDGITVQVLYAMVCDSTLFSIPGAHQFANTLLISAIVQCLVYLAGPQPDFYCNKPDDLSVSDWMNRKHPELDSDTNARAIETRMAVMHEGIPQCGPALENVQKQLESIIRNRNLCQAYQNRLHYDLSSNNHAMRLGVVSALHNYLLDQALMTDEAQTTLHYYVEKIRNLQPEPWEEAEFLNQLSPRSAWTRFRFFTMDCMRQLVLPEERAASSSVREGP